MANLITLDQVVRVRLTTPTTTRKQIARYIGLLQREPSETLDYQKYKLILDYLREYRQMFAFERDMSIETRVKALEEQIRQRDREREGVQRK